MRVLNKIIFLILLPLVSIWAESDTLRVLQMTDIHFCNLTGYHPVFVEKRQHYGNVDLEFQSFLQNAPSALGVDMIVITGDLIDYYEAETSKGPWLDTQVEQFVPLLQECTVPVYLTLGNHDIASYWIEDDEKEQDQVNVQRSRADWIRNASCFQQGTWYSRDFTVGDSEFHFIFLDNGYSLGNGSYLEKPQLDWLEKNVKQAGNKNVVLFMHKYLPVKDYNNDGTVFTVKNQIDLNAETCSKGFLKILNENTNIKAIFNGHGHRSVIEPMQFPSGHTVLQVETAAFAQNPKNWRVLKFTKDSVSMMVTGTEIVEHVFKFVQ